MTDKAAFAVFWTSLGTFMGDRFLTAASDGWLELTKGNMKNAPWFALTWIGDHAFALSIQNTSYWLTRLSDSSLRFAEGTVEDATLFRSTDEGLIEDVLQEDFFGSYTQEKDSERVSMISNRDYKLNFSITDVSYMKELNDSRMKSMGGGIIVSNLNKRFWNEVGQRQGMGSWFQAEYGR